MSDEQMPGPNMNPEESEKILKDPELLTILNNEFDKRIVGEKTARTTILLFSCGRLVENAESTSTNLLVNDESGKGKDYVVRNILKIYGDWGKETIVQHRQRISATAFTYWHNHFFEPDWIWDNRIVYAEDLSNTTMNSDSFKLMASAERGTLNESTITIHQKAVDVGVMGKPAMIVTMASSSPKSEMLRRFPIIELDGSIDQTKAVVKRWGKFKAKGIRPEYDPAVIRAMQYLKSCKVKIPFAELVANVVSCEHYIMRTNFTRMCDLVMFSAALHQFQRESDADGFILATEQDYEIAREIIIAITSTRSTIPQTKKQKSIIETLESIHRL